MFFSLLLSSLINVSHLCSLSSRFVVFANEIDYQAHMRSFHGAQDSRLIFNFNIRRAGRSGDGVYPSPSDMNQVLDSSSHDVNAADVWDYNASDVFHHQPSANATSTEAFPALPTPALPTPSVPIPAAALRSTVPATHTTPASQPRMHPSGSAVTTVPRQNLPQSLISRNQQLASAFGRGAQTRDAIEKELHPKYSAELLSWGKTKFRTLKIIEREIEAMINDRSCFSIHLKAMPREQVRVFVFLIIKRMYNDHKLSYV